MGVSGSIISGDKLQINVGSGGVCRGVVTEYVAEQIVDTVGVVSVEIPACDHAGTSDEPVRKRLRVMDD